MMRSKPFTLSALSIAMAAGLYACSSGGGGSDASPAGNNGGNTSGVTLSGIVSAPSSVATAALNKGLGDKLLDFFLSPAVAELIGLQVVAGATVQVVELDAAGNETGTVVATITTNAAGEYSFTSSAIVPGSRYMVKVTKNALTMRAPLYGPHVNVDPGSEAVVRQVLAQVDGTTITLDDFTPSEFSGLVAMVANSGIDISAAGDLTSAVAAITGDATLALDTVTTSMNSSGDTSSTSQMTGDYNLTLMSGGFDIVGSSVTIKSVTGTNGTATMASGTATHSVNVDEHKIVVAATMTGPSVSVPAVVNNTLSGTTPYYETATHLFYMGDGIGASTPDGNQFVFAWMGSDTNYAEQELAIAGKKLAAAPALSGKTFHLVGLQDAMGPNGTTNAWFDGETYNGTITFTSSTAASVSLISNLLSMDLNDYITDGPESSGTLNDITYSAGSTGALTLNSASLGAGLLKGYVSGAPGNYIGSLISDGGAHDAHNKLITIEAATAATLGTLSGNYNVFSNCIEKTDSDGMPNYNGEHAILSERGVANFDGNGNGTVSMNMNRSGFSANQGTALTLTNTTAMPNNPFTYTVATTGAITIAPNIGSKSGAVSANGNVFAFTDVGTGSRCMTIGVKQ